MALSGSMLGRTANVYNLGRKLASVPYREDEKDEIFKFVNM
jgi:hypothetical protein